MLELGRPRDRKIVFFHPKNIKKFSSINSVQFLVFKTLNLDPDFWCLNPNPFNFTVPDPLISWSLLRHRIMGHYFRGVGKKTGMGDKKPEFRLTLLPRNIQLQPPTPNQQIIRSIITSYNNRVLSKISFGHRTVVRIF